MIEWKEYKLGTLIKSISKTYKFSNEKVCFLNTSDTLEGKVINHNYFDPKDLPGQAKKRIELNDILYSEIRPANKRYAFIDFNVEKYVVSTKLMVLRIINSEVITPKYLYYFLTSDEIVQLLQMLAESRSGTFPQIRFEEISLLDIKLPPIDIQDSIVELISSIDDKIELNNKINQELETLAQTLFKQWFIDFEFPNENGEPYKSSGGEMVESEFGKIPKNWKIGKIGDYIKFIKGKKPLEVFDTESENTLPQILIETLDTGKSMFARPEKMTICEKEDLIMVMDGASSGRIEIGFRGILGSTLAIIKSNGINNNLLYQFLKYKEQDIRNNTTGAAIPHTDKSKIFEYTISLPTENIVSNFSSIQENISKMIFSNKSELKSLTHLRDTLLPKLISGELEINEIKN
jgi:type I restriction enzyme S subunit